MNYKLAKQRGLTKTQIENIKTLHNLREHVLEEIKLADINEEKKYLILLERWRDINYTLQGIWGFKQNKNKHHSWLLPNCICPTMDNNDFGEHYYHTVGCKSCELLRQLDKTFCIK